MFYIKKCFTIFNYVSPQNSGTKVTFPIQPRGINNTNTFPEAKIWINLMK